MLQMRQISIITPSGTEKERAQSLPTEFILRGVNPQAHHSCYDHVQVMHCGRVTLI